MTDMTSNKAGDKVVRTGGASRCWGDSSVGAQQPVARRQVDYLVRGQHCRRVDGLSRAI